MADYPQGSNGPAPDERGDCGAFHTVRSLPLELDPPNPMTPAQLAAGVLALFEGHPDLHDQGTWFYRFVADESYTSLGSDYQMPDTPDCGTRMCAAGAVCTVAGYRLLTVDYQAVVVHPDRPRELMDIADLGARLLRLDATQKRDLFHRFLNEEAVDMLRAIAQGDTAPAG